MELFNCWRSYAHTWRVSGFSCSYMEILKIGSCRSSFCQWNESKHFNMFNWSLPELARKFWIYAQILFSSFRLRLRESEHNRNTNRDYCEPFEQRTEHSCQLYTTRIMSVISAWLCQLRYCHSTCVRRPFVRHMCFFPQKQPYGKTAN